MSKEFTKLSLFKAIVGSVAAGPGFCAVPASSANNSRGKLRIHAYPGGASGRPGQAPPACPARNLLDNPLEADALSAARRGNLGAGRVTIA